MVVDILFVCRQVSEQQVILEKAGVPGFYVTNDPQEIRLQLYLLRFISEISQQPDLAEPAVS